MFKCVCRSLTSVTVILNKYRRFLPVLGKHVLDVLSHKDTEYTRMWKWPMPEKESIPWVDKTNGLEQGELGPRVLRKVVMAEKEDWN